MVNFEYKIGLYYNVSFKAQHPFKDLDFMSLNVE